MTLLLSDPIQAPIGLPSEPNPHRLHRRTAAAGLGGRGSPHYRAPRIVCLLGSPAPPSFPFLALMALMALRGPHFGPARREAVEGIPTAGVRHRVYSSGGHRRQGWAEAHILMCRDSRGGCYFVVQSICPFLTQPTRLRPPPAHCQGYLAVQEVEALPSVPLF